MKVCSLGDGFYFIPGTQTCTLAAAPDSVDAWYGRGTTLVAMNRPQQAIKSFDHVIAAEPGFSQLQLLRAKLQRRTLRRGTRRRF